MVGLDDVLVTGHQDMRDLVLRHVNGLASMMRRHAVPFRFVVAVESNLGLEASHIAYLLRERSDCVVLKETGTAGKCGVLTTNQRKMEFVAVLEDLLLQKAVELSDRIISDDAEACLKTLR